MAITTSTTLRRMAIGLSLIWIAGAFFLSEESERFRWFLLLGILPILIGWTIRWILVSHRRERQQKTRTSRIRLPRWK